MALVLVGARNALTMHARRVLAVIDEFADEHVVVGMALAWRERARAKFNVLSGDFSLNEGESGPVEQTAGQLPAKHQNRSLVLHFLIGEQIAIVGRVGYHVRVSVHDKIERAEPVDELNRVPLVVEQSRGYSRLHAVLFELI